MAIVTQTAAADQPRSADAEPVGVGDGQLDYSLTTVPDPLTVSPASGNVELADLIIVGSRIHPSPIETNEIAVYAPIGTEAWQLVLDYTGLQTSINLTGWSATVDAAGERILFKPDTGHATLTPEQGITVQLDKLRINRQVGTAPIVMALKWRTPGSSAWRTEEQTLGVGKFPAGFHLRNLKATPNYIDNGDSVTLTWERSDAGGAEYTLLYEDKAIAVPNYTTFTVHNVTRSTVFYVRGRIQQGTGTAERTLNTYVTVNKPDLEVKNLEVSGATRMLAYSDMPLPGGVEKIVVAETDGLLAVRASNGRLEIRQSNGPNAWAPAVLVGDDSQDNLMIPMRKGLAAKFAWTSGKVGEARLHWYPFGTGALTFR
ncbi:hypothetical protein ABZ915_29065 [Streptomyces sp. NPDC046915]|uniref:hypothetical protein n=1 Tax=Streptomyces sp. NPDC046915 TaxID=3155257 RepID=UPI0033C63B36